jgi:hypothetical protein
MVAVILAQAALGSPGLWSFGPRFSCPRSLARVEGSNDSNDGRSVLRGVVPLDYRTTDRIVVLNLPGNAQCEFKLRLAADPSRSEKFRPWHLADRVAIPSASETTDAEPRHEFAIRYRVL